MTDASQWRLHLARQLAPVYAAHPHVQAIILGGSAAAGYADRYSDIEIGVFWDRPPSDDERQELAAHAGGDQLTLDPYDLEQDVGIEDYYVDQANIDLVHRTVAGTDRLIADVLDQFDSTLHKQTLIHALRHAVPLRDAPMLTQWHQRTDTYPDALRRAVVDHQLRFKPWWSVEVLAERQSLIIVNYALCMVADRLLAALGAINRQYYAGNKWLPQSVARLKLAPPMFGDRLTQCFTGTVGDRVAMAAALVEETFDLAEQQVPDLDIAAHRATFRTRRLPVDRLPERLS